MKRVVVDSSVIVAGLAKDGKVRESLVTASELAFAAPAYVGEEVKTQVPRIAARAKLPRATVEAILEDLLCTVDLVPPAHYASKMRGATAIAHRAGVPGDEDFVALCMALEAPIWTLDRDFLRVPGLVVLSTTDIGGI